MFMKRGRAVFLAMATGALAVSGCQTTASSTDEIILDERVGRVLDQYMTTNKRRTFAIALDGQSFGWATCDTASRCRGNWGQSAIKFCEARARKNGTRDECILYARNDQIVYAGRVQVAGE